ncbi:hypothetical protein [Asticcacaulis sp.]|uniref:hypothetical protein n=1 Tax=Asticcacaulis sp. TaxID=1872648 RepID=UPI002CCFDE45|nr:hypothetical protein [Asticcacaulis sp.]HTM81913.1 hypothetical protein [Asticcacaulis sp.]
MSEPQVFIIESLDPQNPREGEILERALKVMRKKPIYRYIETRAQFEEAIEEFRRSRIRYLHISCHGNKDGIWTTKDFIPTAEAAMILAKVMNRRRLFLSSCQVTRRTLAEAVFAKATCYSIAGPRGSIRFDDAMVFWIAFYHIMFKADRFKMKRAMLKRKITLCANMVEERINVFLRDDDGGATLFPVGRHVNRPMPAD